MIIINNFFKRKKQNNLILHFGTSFFRKEIWKKAGSSKTTSEIQRKHPVLAPEDFGKLKDREFILFYEKGIASRKVIEVSSQQQDILPIRYIERKDVIEFLRDF